LILVVVEAAEADRVSEGLRAGIGLGLRGDDVVVVLTGPAARFADTDDPRIARALRTLRELRRPARFVDEAELAGLLAEARAVEAWSSAGAGGRLLRIGDRAIEVAGARFRNEGRAIDAAEVVAQILGSDGPIVIR
jgi:hypothetical protein